MVVAFSTSPAQIISPPPRDKGVDVLAQLGSPPANPDEESYIQVSSPPYQPGNPSEDAAGSSRVLQELHEVTHFGVDEVNVLFQQFKQLSMDNQRLTKAAFDASLSHVFGGMEDQNALMQHLWTACCSQPGSEGTINFRQFACVLSTLFRGSMEEVLNLWFRMYDDDHDGYLKRDQFEEMLHDVNQAVQKRLETAATDAWQHAKDETASKALKKLGEGDFLAYDDFLTIMESHHVLPVFASPHTSGDEMQHEALLQFSAAEREVLSLLGADQTLEKGDCLITEGTTDPYFFFILTGEVELVRNNVRVSVQNAGNFVGEAALFSDVKAAATDGSVKFTTTVRAVGPVRAIKMDIRDFYPLVYHEHPGATDIMQRLGRVMTERIQETEDKLQALIDQSPLSESDRMSREDWIRLRKNMMRRWALRFHKIGRKGKIEVVATKGVGTAADLSVAYSPGVAEPCVNITKDEAWAYDYTAKGHLVGVITNGTAVLGLGNIGPLAAKPVMEGKAVLFKKFADIDAFDIELNCPDPEMLVKMVVAMEPTFGGINLEDIKAPECFYVEKECQKRMKIPVFHDDQHGTAIIAGAGLLNALELVDKAIGDIRVVVCGCGAAGFTCAKYFVSLGVKAENLLAVDVKGVVYKGREDLVDGNYLCEVAVDTELRTLAEAVEGADVFLGLSAGGLLKPEMLRSMNRDPLVFACANPTPEIDPSEARQVRPDVIMATGRSDHPNQINNVCAFPHIFRGALDCRATTVNEAMKVAATHAIAGLAKTAIPRKQSLSRSSSYNELGDNNSDGGYNSGYESEGRLHASSSNASLGDATPRGRDGDPKTFGRDFIIPLPFDSRLMAAVSSAVVKAAQETGVARLDLELGEYRRRLKDIQRQLNR